MFTSARQAVTWREAGMISEKQRIYEVIENSTNFKPLSRDKSHSTLTGEPVFLWVGRLNSNKDPLTVLEGFAQASRDLPNPHLFMIYSSTELLDAVKSIIQRLNLSDHVHLLGKQPHERLEALFVEADYFLLGSHEEGSGFALLEALACGVTPIVTDIPSFRHITGDATVGALWAPGDPQSLASAIRLVVSRKSDRDATRKFFEECLSFRALGEKALQAYSDAYSIRNNMSMKAESSIVDVLETSPSLENS